MRTGQTGDIAPSCILGTVSFIILTQLLLTASCIQHFTCSLMMR